MRIFIAHLDRSTVKNKIVDTLVVIRTDEGKFQCGYARMSDTDNWNRKLGNTIATGRAKKHSLRFATPEGALGHGTDIDIVPCAFNGMLYTSWPDLIECLSALCWRCLCKEQQDG